MTPTAVKAYLRDRHRASLGDIATHFGSTPEAVRPILSLWQNKGRLRCLNDAGDDGCACTKGCGRCSGATHSRAGSEVYEWLS